MKANVKQNIVTIIGIGNHVVPQLTAAQKAAIISHEVFSGGKRHYELLLPFLPIRHKWITITSNMEGLIARFSSIEKPILVFASGDPLFYGFGNTLQRLLPDRKLIIEPYFNSIQRLCHKTQTNYNSLRTVSVHGRDWSKLDVALITTKAQIGGKKDRAKV